MLRALLPTMVLLPVAAVVSAASAAPVADEFVPSAKDDPALVAAWQKWEKRDIEDYSTTVVLSCFCPETVAVRTVVRDGEVVRVRSGPDRLNRADGYSMDQLFSMLREGHATADRVEVTYTGRGVPKSITIDPEKTATDEERYYSVSLSRL